MDILHFSALRDFVEDEQNKQLFAIKSTFYPENPELMSDEIAKTIFVTIQSAFIRHSISHPDDYLNGNLSIITDPGTGIQLTLNTVDTEGTPQREWFIFTRSETDDSITAFHNCEQYDCTNVEPFASYNLDDPVQHMKYRDLTEINYRTFVKSGSGYPKYFPLPASIDDIYRQQRFAAFILENHWSARFGHDLPLIGFEYNFETKKCSATFKNEITGITLTLSTVPVAGNSPIAQSIDDEKVVTMIQISSPNRELIEEIVDESTGKHLLERMNIARTANTAEWQDGDPCISLFDRDPLPYPDSIALIRLSGHLLKLINKSTPEIPSGLYLQD